MIKKAFFIPEHIELVKKKKFAIIAFDPKHKIFIVYIAFFNSSSND